VECHVLGEDVEGLFGEETWRKSTS